ncbi:prefoldin subunit beta [Thermogymnomonas acidicola]|uniref:Prefoldin subunit beta n=1 Tax=Thermogymnomonas acidicola TaxID=399579 RepID=A0AA37BRE9_9ARCH|nr:prefoldin subunit beta [Thermogymnomonas acidicola]GGM74491.1 prefoldin subunit beta [Thermogymnomonas acidicola]
MEPNLSTYIQNQIRQAQQLETQIEQIATQRYQLDLRVKEIEKTLKELEKVPEGVPVYKNLGTVMYQVQDKKTVVDELTEQKELTEIRLKTLEKQQKALEDKYKELEGLIKQRMEDLRKGGQQ